MKFQKRILKFIQIRYNITVVFLRLNRKSILKEEFNKFIDEYGII